MLIFNYMKIMKKLFLLFLLVSLFSVMQKEVSAQNGVYKDEISFEMTLYNPCLDVNLSGLMTLQLKVFKNSYQAKSTGELTDPDGNVYTTRWIQNSGFSLDKLVLTQIYFDESGNPVFKVHITSQVRFNAKGEPTATVENEVIECF